MKIVSETGLVFFIHSYSYNYVEDSRAKGESDQAREERLLLQS